MHELKGLYTWLDALPGMWPDVEIGQLDDYCAQRKHQNKKADLHAVQTIIAKYHHRSTACPDVEIGSVLYDIAQIVKQEITKNTPFTEAEALVLAHLWLKPRTLDSLWNTISDDYGNPANPFYEVCVQAMYDDYWGIPDTLYQTIAYLKAEEYLTESLEGFLCTTAKLMLT